MIPSEVRGLLCSNSGQLFLTPAFTAVKFELLLCSQTSPH